MTPLYMLFLVAAASCLTVPKGIVLDLSRSQPTQTALDSKSSIPLTNALKNQFFLASVESGNEQKFKLAVDTGSSILGFEGQTSLTDPRQIFKIQIWLI